MEIAKNNSNIEVKIFTGLINVFYTDITNLKKGEWEIIGKQELTKEESDNFQYHNTGGNLYKGDEYIRALSVEEYKTIPKMLSAGYEAISDFLKMAFTS
jgi:hypothetical protein